MLKKIGYLLFTALIAVALTAGSVFAAAPETPVEEPAVSAPDQDQPKEEKGAKSEQKKKKMKMAKKKQKKHAEEEGQDAPSDAPKSETN